MMLAHKGKRVKVDKWWVMQFSMITTFSGLAPLVKWLGHAHRLHAVLFMAAVMRCG